MGDALLLLLPESTRKAAGGTAEGADDGAVVANLPDAAAGRLRALRRTLWEAWDDPPDPPLVLPAYARFQGNMYRRIPQAAWEAREAGVEVVIVSGLYGLAASRDPVVAYPHSMAEVTPPFGRLNGWWRANGLPDLLRAYLRASGPPRVVDLLSQAYRKAVAGYDADLEGVQVTTIDFPGLGRGSQPRRGEIVAAALRTGEVPSVTGGTLRHPKGS